jgi:hypothetical protein
VTATLIECCKLNGIKPHTWLSANGSKLAADPRRPRRRTHALDRRALKPPLARQARLRKVEGKVSYLVAQIAQGGVRGERETVPAELATLRLNTGRRR